MRIRFLRILPEIAASTTCSLLSRRTLKKALGCLSIIVPSAGIKSSAANQVLLGSELRLCLGHNNTPPVDFRLPIADCQLISREPAPDLSSIGDRKSEIDNILNLFKKALDTLPKQA